MSFFGRCSIVGKQRDTLAIPASYSIPEFPDQRACIASKQILD
jgi:hypothetical protein